MVKCSKCHKYIANRDLKNHDNQNQPICDECYHEQKAQQIKSDTTLGSPGVEVRGASIHLNKVMTPEEIKREFEKGPPKFDDKELHVIDHEDEKSGNLWIDGKKVRKDNPDESK